MSKELIIHETGLVITASRHIVGCVKNDILFLEMAIRRDNDIET